MNQIDKKKININWFPGHMKKASKGIEEKLKYIDFVIVVLDARAPNASLNNYLIKLVKDKRKLFILNKKDLADDYYTKLWIDKLNNNGNIAISTSLDSKAKKIIFEKIVEFCKEKEKKNEEKGIKNTVSRAMVIGIPNVGKSTLINLLVGKKIQIIKNLPGVTRALTWIKVRDNFELLDTPGIMPPKIEKNEDKILLSLIGSIKEEILPLLDDITSYCINFLKENYYGEFMMRYSISDLDKLNDEEIYERIALKRGLLLKGGELDIKKAKYLFFKEFKDGKICKLTLERDV